MKCLRGFSPAKDTKNYRCIPDLNIQMHSPGILKGIPGVLLFRNENRSNCFKVNGLTRIKK